MGIKSDTNYIVISMSDINCGEAKKITVNASNTINGTIDATAPPRRETPELKPFKCANCGGNSYSVKDGIARCDYCGTMLR